MEDLEKTIKKCESFIKELFEKKVIIEATRNEWLGHLYQTRDDYLEGKNCCPELEFVNGMDSIYSSIKKNIMIQIGILKQKKSHKKRIKNDPYEIFTKELMKIEYPYSADELIKLYIDIQKKYS